MSQTWVIKDTAPVDEASITLATTFISFTTNNQKATSIGLDPNGSVIRVIYGGIGDIAGCGYGIGPAFVWTNEAYKTLEFDTAPTGELLAWLQKNADKQSEPEYLTLKSELTSVADAIRTKGGTSAQLVYPAGFVSAIQAIQTGVPLQIVVTTSAGATVTATKGSKTVSGTADASGNCTLIVDEVGTWTVTAATASTTKTADVVVGTANVDLAMIDPVFGNNSWAAIIKACQEKQVPNTWNVGDSCNMTINNKTYAIDIIGKNHDDYADGSGKAPLTFQLHVCYSKAKMLSSNVTYTWQKSTMRTSTLPAILKRMPAEVQAAIREVTKLTGASAYLSELDSTADKLFILSDDELGIGYNSVAGEGTMYEYYTGASSRRIKQYNNTNSYWWLRSICTDNNYKGSVKCINTSGSLYQFSGSATDYGVTFGFCF
jgi:hypothetical protein